MCVKPVETFLVCSKPFGTFCKVQTDDCVTNDLGRADFVHHYDVSWVSRMVRNSLLWENTDMVVASLGVPSGLAQGAGMGWGWSVGRGVVSQMTWDGS